MLLTAAENKRDSLTIILAGYKDEIEGKLYTSDAGFKSRFRQVEGGGDRHSWDEKKGQARSHGTRVLFAERRVRRAYATSSLPRVQVTFEDFNYPELRVILKGLIDKYSWTCQVCAFNMAYTSDGARMLSARCGRVHKSDATDVCSSRLHLIVPAIPTLHHSLFFFPSSRCCCVPTAPPGPPRGGRGRSPRGAGARRQGLRQRPHVPHRAGEGLPGRAGPRGRDTGVPHSKAESAGDRRTQRPLRWGFTA